MLLEKPAETRSGLSGCMLNDGQLGSECYGSKGGSGEDIRATFVLIVHRTSGI